MPVVSVHSDADYQKQISTQQLVVIDFTASWCGPCKVMAPIFEKLSNQYTQAVFLKVDVDELSTVAQLNGITAMPTFVFLKNKKKVDELKGANAAQLEVLIKKHIGDATASSSSSSEASLDPGYVLLNGQVHEQQVECLNHKTGQSVGKIFQSKNKQLLESDCDEQLILAIQFKQQVKIHSLKLVAPLKNAPKTLKLYANKSHLGFDEAESIEPTQTIVLTEKDYEEKAIISLRFVKFQNINSLAIFIQDNLEGEDVTALQELQFYGVLVDQTRDLKELKKNDE